MGSRAGSYQVPSKETPTSAESDFFNYPSSFLNPTGEITITDSNHPIALLHQLVHHSIIALTSDQYDELVTAYKTRAEQPFSNSQPQENVDNNPQTIIAKLQSSSHLQQEPKTITKLCLNEHRLPSTKSDRCLALSLIHRLVELKKFPIEITLSQGGQATLQQALFEDIPVKKQSEGAKTQQQDEELQSYLSKLSPEQRLELDIYSRHKKTSVEKRLIMHCILTIYKQLQLGTPQHPLIPPSPIQDNDNGIALSKSINHLRQHFLKSINHLRQHFLQVVAEFEAAEPPCSEETLDTLCKKCTDPFVTELSKLCNEIENTQTNLATSFIAAKTSSNAMDRPTPDVRSNYTQASTRLHNQNLNVAEYRKSISTTIDITQLAITNIEAAQLLFEHGRINSAQKTALIDATFNLVTNRGPNPQAFHQTMIKTPIAPSQVKKIIGRTAIVLGTLIAIAAAATIFTAALSFSAAALPYIIASIACLSSITTLGGYLYQKPSQKTSLATSMAKLSVSCNSVTPTVKIIDLDAPQLTMPTPY